MFTDRKSLILLSAAAFACASGVLAAVMVSGDEPDRQGGQVSPPAVPQKAAASDAGYTVRVLSADFSGTESILELQIDGPGDPSLNDSVTIPAAAFARGSIGAVGPEGLTVALGKRGLVRMRPHQTTGAPNLSISQMVRRDADGSARTIEGKWDLPLDLGGKAADLLWVDELRPGPTVSDGGVTIRPVRLLRSRSETLVTVELTGPAGITQLALPFTSSGGARVYGARVTQDIDGLTTFAFPPTERGTPFQFEMGDLIAQPEPGSGGYVDLALGEIIRERGLTGAFKEQAPVEARQLRGTPGSVLTVRTIYFARLSDDVPASNVLNLTVDGTYDDPAGFSLQLASGETLILAGSGSGYSRGPTGDTTRGRPSSCSTSSRSNGSTETSASPSASLRGFSAERGSFPSSRSARCWRGGRVAGVTVARQVRPSTP